MPLGILRTAHEPVAYIKLVSTATRRTGGKAHVQSRELPTSILGPPLQRNALLCNSACQSGLSASARQSIYQASWWCRASRLGVCHQCYSSPVGQRNSPVYKLPSSCAPLAKKVRPEEVHPKAASKWCLASSENLLQSQLGWVQDGLRVCRNSRLVSAAVSWVLCWIYAVGLSDRQPRSRRQDESVLL